jgi:hypothetical protein
MTYIYRDFEKEALFSSKGIHKNLPDEQLLDLVQYSIPGAV